MSQKRIKKTIKKQEYLVIIEQLKANLELSNAVLGYVFHKCFGNGELVISVDDFDAFVKTKIAYVNSQISDDKKYCTLKLVGEDYVNGGSDESSENGAEIAGILGRAVEGRSGDSASDERNDVAG